jgi:vacuolar protein sorting-associated protein 11
MSIHTHLNYLVIVSPPFAPSASSASATVRNFVARSGLASGANSDVTKVTVFELENGIVGYSGTFPGGIREIFSAWDEIYILPNDGKVTSHG